MRVKIIYLFIDLMASVPHGRGDIVDSGAELLSMVVGRERDREKHNSRREDRRQRGKEREKDTALLVDFLLFPFILTGSPAYGIL